MNSSATCGQARCGAGIRAGCVYNVGSAVVGEGGRKPQGSYGTGLMIFYGSNHAEETA